VDWIQGGSPRGKSRGKIDYISSGSISQGNPRGITLGAGIGPIGEGTLEGLAQGFSYGLRSTVQIGSFWSLYV
jgi:hypothetical protein